MFRIAEGLSRNEGPFTLRYTTMSDLAPMYASTFSISVDMHTDDALQRMEEGLIRMHSPKWNR